MKAALITFVFLFAGVASAQVNTEEMRTGDAKPGFHGFASGSFSLRKGNVDLIQGGLGARLEYNVDIHEPFIQGDLQYGKKSDETYINKGFVHLRWTAMWNEAIGSELFTQIQFNEFTRLTYRTLGGVGFRAALLKNKTIEMFLGMGYMASYEELDIDADSQHSQSSFHHQSTNYLTIRLNLTDILALVSTTYYQTRLTDFSDFRILEQAGLEITLHENVSLVESFSLAHDSKPPDDVEETDITTTTSIKLVF